MKKTTKVIKNDTLKRIPFEPSMGEGEVPIIDKYEAVIDGQVVTVTRYAYVPGAELFRWTVNPTGKYFTEFSKS